MVKPPKTRSKASNSKGISKPSIIAVCEDEGETIGLMEPMLVGESSRWRGEVSALAVDLTYEATDFKARLPIGIRAL